LGDPNRFRDADTLASYVDLLRIYGNPASAASSAHVDFRGETAGFAIGRG